MIHVVSAVIVRHGRILLTQRMPPRDFAFCWECPGGKLDAGEDHDAGLRRELREELNAWTKEIGPSIWSGTLPGYEVTITFYPVTLFWKGRFTLCPLEGQGVGFFTATELRDSLDLTPGNRAAARSIYDHIL